MDTVIKLLRERTILCRRMLELFNSLNDGLKNNSDEIIQIVANVEKIMPDLLNVADNTQKFLSANKFKNLADYIDAQNDSVQKNVASNLLKQADLLQNKLRQNLETANKLADSANNFITFNVNIMSQTRADVYGANKLAESQSKRIVEFSC